MGGEDFAFYLLNKPGCFFFVGSHPTDSDVFLPHHNGAFNIEEEPTLALGASVWVQLAEDLLIPPRSKY
jgi:metal-dependent amidase/aminoacylase/carboxypeptidase family protein